MKFPINLSQSGAILTIVLWAILLLTIIATFIINISLSLRKDESVYVNKSEIVSAIDNGMRLAIMDLMNKKIILKKWKEEHTYTIYEKTIEVSISGEDGKINIYRAPAELIEILMREHKIEVDSIDKSTGFDFTRSLLNATHTKKAYNNLLQDLTVFSRLAVPQKEIASPRIAQVIDEYWGENTADIKEPVLNAVDITAKTLRIEGCHQKNPKQQLCRLAIIRITGSPHNPYQVFTWVSTFSL
jgi:hypothetical protein